MTEDIATTREDVASSLHALGVTRGDSVYIRAGLRALGPLAGSVEDVFLGGLFDAIGDEGTLLVPAFVPISKIWERDIPISDRHARSYAGAVSNMVLEHPRALRSDHPTHSFAAVGREAESILRGHTGDHACFEPIRKLMALDGKMLLIGCHLTSPGFSTVHLAQYDLGLSRRHYSRLLRRVRVSASPDRYYRPIESPGCSNGFGVFYSDYIDAGNLATGYVGDAWTVVVGAARAYAVEKDRLRADPRCCVCRDPGCASCRLLRGYNKRAAPRALLARLARGAGRALRKRADS